MVDRSRTLLPVADSAFKMDLWLKKAGAAVVVYQVHKLDIFSPVADAPCDVGLWFISPDADAVYVDTEFWQVGK